MLAFGVIIIASVVQPLNAQFPYCLFPWQEGYPTAEAPTFCNAASDCVGADNPACVFSVRIFRRVCCHNRPPTSPYYMEPPLCPAGSSLAGDVGIQCNMNGPDTCPKYTRCIESAKFANITGLQICCRPSTNGGPAVQAFVTEGIVPTFLTRCPLPLPAGASFSVAFDTLTVKNGQRFDFNDTNRAKVIGNSFKISYKYPRTKPVNATFPGEQFFLIIFQADAENRLKPLKRSLPAFVAELTLADENVAAGVATIEFSQSTPTPIVASSFSAPTAHPAQPYNRYVIILFKKNTRQPTSSPTIKEFGDSLDPPFKIPQASAGLWNVKGYLEKLAFAKYIDSNVPLAGLVYLVQSTAT